MEKDKEKEKENEQIIDLDKLAISPIAIPMSSEKMTKKLMSLITKLAKVRLIKRGVKEVNKYFRKKKESNNKQKSFCVLAGDVSPVDVISHIPILCEKNKVPYIYIPSRQLLGTASCTKRPTSVVILIEPPEDNKYNEKFNSMMEIVKKYDDTLDAEEK
jgi:H/ACA ribonucleoprotein complex subunit 2